MTAKHYRIEWRTMAREDLRAIVRYIGKDNPARAKRFSQELRDKASQLAQHPELGRQGRPGLPDWLRELVVQPNYIVFLSRVGRDPHRRDFESEARSSTNTVTTKSRVR